MFDAEQVYKLGDGVVGHYALDEIPLMHPPHSVLVAGQFHPHAVLQVFGHDLNFSHYKRVAMVDARAFAQRVDGLTVQRTAALQR